MPTVPYLHRTRADGLTRLVTTALHGVGYTVNVQACSVDSNSTLCLALQNNFVVSLNAVKKKDGELSSERDFLRLCGYLIFE